MTKEDIVNQVWEELDVSKKQAAELVESLISGMKSVLTSGETLKISGFGVFEVRHRNARMGRNPKTGAAAEIKEGRTLRFRAGKVMKNRVKQGI